MRKRLHSVRAIILLATLVILVVTATTALLLWHSRQNQLEHAKEERNAITALFVKQAKHDLNSISLVLKVVQERIHSPYGIHLKLDSPEVFLLLGARVAASEPTSSMFIVDATGTIVNTSLGYPPNRLQVADRDYFKAFANKSASELFISHPVRNRINNKWTIYFSRPLRWEDGRLRGVLVAAVPPSRFEDLFETLRLGVKREMSFHMTDGTLIASQPHREENIGQIEPQQAGDASGQSLNDNMALREINGFPMYAKVATDEDSALATWRQAATPIALGSLMVCLTIVGFSIWLANELVREESLRQALSDADARHIHTVESTNLQLRQLSSRLLDVREAERARLSRELHDDLGQQLTGLKLDLAWLGTRVKDGRAIEPERVDTMRQLLDHAIASVRRISSDLRPPILDDLGFGEAIRWLTQEMAKRSKLAINLTMPAESLVTAPALATALFRITQEALTNIIRHAEASQVTIHLEANDGRLQLNIHDNGKGMAKDNIAGGIGLASMQERVVALGGEFSMIDTPGAGLAIEAVFPLHPPDIALNDT